MCKNVSRKMLIQQKYSEFYDLLKENDFNDEISMFPDLNDIDITDLTYFLTFAFIGINDEKDFKIKIQDLAYVHGVTLSENQINFVTPLLTGFMKFLREL